MSSEYFSAFSPMTKNVARRLCRFKISSTRSVKGGVGPSSKVSATLPPARSARAITFPQRFERGKNVAHAAVAAMGLTAASPANIPVIASIIPRHPQLPHHLGRAHRTRRRARAHGHHERRAVDLIE